MAMMSFRVSKSEFTSMMWRILDKRKAEVNEEDLEELEKPEQRARAVVDFFQSFMIDMEDESLLHYDYELVVDGETIPLDDEGSDERLRELVVSALI